MVGVPLHDLFTDPEAWKPVTFSLVEQFLDWQLQNGYAIDSINIHLTTVKRYAALACRVGVLSSDELFRIREVKGFRRMEGRRIDAKRPVTRIGAKKAAPTFLTEEQLMHLFQVPDLTTPQGWRDLLLLRLLYDLGLRPGEVISLQIVDIDLQQQRLRVCRHKTDGEQFLRPTNGISTAATRYLQLRRDRDPGAPLLVRTLKNGHLVELVQQPDGSLLTPSCHLRGIQKRIHQLGSAIGVNLNAYDARHQWTRDALDAGNTLTDILTAGGWSKDSPMVRRYSGERTIANERITLNR